jgi:hypothetical protein
MIDRIILRMAFLASMALTGCAPVDDLSSEELEGDVEAAQALVQQQALAGPGISCGRETLAHGLAHPVAGAKTCLVNSECNTSPTKPPCAAQTDNLCTCTARDAAGSCMAGQCTWHPDPGNLSCVCVPGQALGCTLDGAAGFQVCNAMGTAWEPCTE